MIRELKTHPAWEVYEDWLRFRLQQHSRRVMGGKISSLEAYREECGIVRGLTVAIKAEEDVEELVLAEVGRRESSAEQG